MASLRSWFALLRSIMVYYGDRERHRRMDGLYAQFVKPGNLVFDIGAHVGDRITSFRRLGARVVALEPQPGPAAILQFLFGRDRAITLLRKAAAGKEGELPLHINSQNPTVSTISDDFVRAAQGAQNWEGQCWDGIIAVPTTTLDVLINTYGDPAFIKIDVEGYEQVVLVGPDHSCTGPVLRVHDDCAGGCDRMPGSLGGNRRLQLQCFAWGEPGTCLSERHHGPGDVPLSEGCPTYGEFGRHLCPSALLLTRSLQHCVIGECQRSQNGIKSCYVGHVRSGSVALAS